MRLAASAILGLVFGIGILVSGMGNPAKVLNFFDVAGHWDPSLAFVMGGALLVTWVGYRLAFRRSAPVFENEFALPLARAIDLRLLGGSAVFGIGWGLAGFCPGAVIPTLAIGRLEPVLFFVSMATGIALTRLYLSPAPAASDAKARL